MHKVKNQVVLINLENELISEINRPTVISLDKEDNLDEKEEVIDRNNDLIEIQKDNKNQNLDCKFLSCKHLKNEFKNVSQLNREDNHQDHQLDNSVLELANSTELDPAIINNLLSKLPSTANSKKRYHNYVLLVGNNDSRLVNVSKDKLRLFITKYIGKGVELRSISHVKLAYYLFKLNIRNTKSWKINLVEYNTR